jgi:DNA topoisomerase-1
MDALTLDQAMELFKLPRTLGETAEGEPIVANVGRFGPYVKYGSKYVSLKEDDPYTVTLERALEVIRLKKEADANRIINEFGVDNIQVLNGRYGPYVTDGKKNAKIPKDREPKSLTLEECRVLIAAAPERGGGRFGRGRRGAKGKGAPAAGAAAAAGGTAATGAGSAARTPTKAAATDGNGQVPTPPRGRSNGKAAAAEKTKISKPQRATHAREDVPATRPAHAHSKTVHTSARATSPARVSASAKAPAHAVKGKANKKSSKKKTARKPANAGKSATQRTRGVK